MKIRFCINQRNISYMEATLSGTNQTSFENEQIFSEKFGKATFLKMVLWDLPISALDIAMDMSIGISLCQITYKMKFGIASFATDWVPGIVRFAYICIFPPNRISRF